jgi:sugar phosphate isomerase/epimerase
MLSDNRNKPQKEKNMIVALHSAPKGFFRTSPPHSNSELVALVREAASLGFKAVQIGPLIDYVPIEGERLRSVLNSVNMKRNVHVGGIYDAKKFALTEEEYAKARKQMHYGIKLCMKICSTLVSVHPPFFAVANEINEEILSRARMRFLELLKEEVDFAGRNHIETALESFCYPPFIFEGLRDFTEFISKFPSDKLGVLLDAGHVYQIGINLYDAVQAFRHRLLDIHVHDATLEKDYREATHLPIGRGTINFPEFISILRENAYDRWLTLEIRGNEKEIVDSKEYLENQINTTPNGLKRF